MTEGSGEGSWRRGVTEEEGKGMSQGGCWQEVGGEPGEAGPRAPSGAGGQELA